MIWFRTEQVREEDANKIPVHVGVEGSFISAGNWI